MSGGPAQTLHALVVAAVLAAFPACATTGTNDPNLGISGSTAESRPGLYQPLQPGDLDAIAQRGRLLYDMERSLMLGYERGMFRVGDPGSTIVLPLVDVDAGGRSGQVVFYRWLDKDVPDAANLDPARAQRWLLVSLVLWPDNVLDVEQLHDYVVAKTLEHQRIAALIAAAKRAAQLAPDQTFHMHLLREQIAETGRRTGKGRDHQFRVFLFAAERGGKDMELTVVLGKKDVPTVSSVTVAHEPGDVGDKLIHARGAEPGPMTVARALQMGHTSGVVAVDTDDGGSYTVSTEDGRISRQ